MVYRGGERRKRYRVKVRLPLIIKSAKGGILTYTTNLSLLGASVESNQKLGPSTKREEFIIELTPSRRVRCSGVVLRCESKAKPVLLNKNCYYLSIFFSNFFNNGEQRLADYLEVVLARQKKVLDRWIKSKKQKTKSKMAKEKKAKAKSKGLKAKSKKAKRR